MRYCLSPAGDSIRLNRTRRACRPCRFTGLAGLRRICRRFSPRVPSFRLSARIGGIVPERPGRHYHRPTIPPRSEKLRCSLAVLWIRRPPPVGSPLLCCRRPSNWLHPGLLAAAFGGWVPGERRRFFPQAPPLLVQGVVDGRPPWDHTRRGPNCDSARRVKSKSPDPFDSNERLVP